jgi:hypothetical protein
MTRSFFLEKHGCLSSARSCWMGAGGFPYTRWASMGKIFAVNEDGVVRLEAAVKLEVTTMTIRYDNENDVIARRE